MADGITLDQIWDAVGRIAKEQTAQRERQVGADSERDKQLSRMAENLRSIERAISNVETMSAQVAENTAHLEQNARMAEENRARLLKLEEWHVRHEQFARDRDADIRSNTQSIADNRTIADVLRGEIADVRKELSDHTHLPHLQNGDVSSTRLMLTDWKTAAGDKHDIWQEIRRLAYSSPILVIISLGALLVGAWLQHAFHFVK